MINILNKERTHIESKIIAETFESVINNESHTYDFENKTEVINVEFINKNYLPLNTHILIKDESKIDAEFVCIKENGMNSVLIPHYAKDLSNKFIFNGQKGNLKDVLSNLITSEKYALDFNDLVEDKEIEINVENKKTIFECLVEIALKEGLSIRHKYDIARQKTILLIKKGKELRKENPKIVDRRIPGFDFNIYASKIKTALIVYNKSDDSSITMKDEINHSRFIEDDEYNFDTIEVDEPDKEKVEQLASDYLNRSSLNAIDIRLTGYILRQWTNCNSNKFISSTIFIDYKLVNPELINGYTIYKFEKSLFDYNLERINFYAKKIYNDETDELQLDNYLKDGSNKVKFKDLLNENTNNVKLLEKLVNIKFGNLKEYIDGLTFGNSSKSDGSINLSSNKVLNFDAIISDFNLIRSQKDQINNQLKSIFDSAYLKQDSIKIQVRDKIKEIDSGFERLTEEVNKLNRDFQDEVLMKHINALFINYYSVLKYTKSIIEISNESINIEMNKLQNEYSHGIKDSVFNEISRILGLRYDSKTKTLKGDINVMQDITSIRNSLDLMSKRISRVEEDLNNDNRRVERNLIELKNNLSTVLGLPINSESGLIEGDINKQDLFDQIKEKIDSTKREVENSKNDLIKTKEVLEKHQEELHQKSLDIDNVMAEANRVRDDLNEDLETTQQEFDYYTSSRGDNLIFNGNADQGDNSNFNELYYDTSDAFQSAASFRMEGFNTVYHSDRLIPINPEKTYKLSMFVKNNSNLPSSIGHLSYDKDGLLIESQHVMGSEKPVLELAQELRQGDKVVYFKSLKGLEDSYRFFAAPVEDDTPNYDYDRDGSVEIPYNDLDSMDDPNTIVWSDDQRVYAEDTKDAEDITEEDLSENQTPDTPFGPEDIPVETNSTPVNEEEAIKNMTNDYNVSNAGIVNRNTNPDLTDYNDNHSFVIWNFKSNDGYDYGVSTYSRDVFMNGWDFGAIDRENNCIYLNRPFDLINYDSEDGSYPAGTKISGTYTDSNIQWSLFNHKDFPDLSDEFNDDPEEFSGWYHRQGLITKENIKGTNGFLYGSFFMRLYFLVNEYDENKDNFDISYEDNSDEPKFWITNIEMYDVTGLESVRKAVIDTNELVATMMTKKEMDDYRKQVTENFSQVSQTVDRLSQEVNKKIKDLDDNISKDITSKLETVAGKIELLSEEQTATKEETEKRLADLKVETDKISSIVERVSTNEDNYSKMNTRVNQLSDSYDITAEKVDKQDGQISDLSGKLTVASDQITQEIKDRKKSINDTSESLNSSIKLTADSIRDEVSKNYSTKSELSETTSSLKTSMTNEIGRIESKVESETSTESIAGKVKIGTKNILLGTEKFELPFLPSISKIEKNGIKMALVDKNKTEVSQIVKVKPDTNYILSYDSYTQLNTGEISTPITKASSLNEEVSPKDYLITENDSKKNLDKNVQRYSFRFNSKSNEYLKIYFTANEKSYILVGHIQLEEGNVASTWDVSPDDYKARFAKNESSITQTEKDIKLNSSSISQLENTTTKQYGELKVETDKISGIVKKQTEMDGKISANASSIEQMPDQIRTQVTAVQKDLGDRIDNLSVGGRNLILGTKDYNSSHWDGILDKKIEKDGSIFTPLQKSDGSQNWINQTFKTEPNNDYIISFDAYKDGGGKGNIYPQVRKLKDDKSDYDPFVSIFSFNQHNKVLTNDVKRYSIPFNSEESKYMRLYLTREEGSKANIYVANIKVEKGNKATDWTPAPEDIEGKISNLSSVTSSIDQKADSIQLSVSKINEEMGANNLLINSDFRNGWEGWVNGDKEDSLKLNYAEEIDSPYWTYTFAGSSEQYETDTTTTDKSYLKIRSNANEGWKQWQTSSEDYYDALSSPKLSKLKGGTYTFSFRARKSRETTAGRITISLRINKSGETLNPLSFDINAESDITQDWLYYEKTFTVTDSELENNKKLRLIIASVSPYYDGEFFFKDIRLDKAVHPQRPRFTISDEEDLTINLDDNLALASKYRTNNVSTNGNYRRFHLQLAKKLKRNQRYKISFDYNIISGTNSQNLITILPYRFPYKGGEYDDGTFLPVIPSTKKIDVSIEPNKRNVIDFTNIDEDGVNQLVFYAAQSGTEENKNIEASFENIKVVEYVDGKENTDYDDRKVKNALKYKQNNFGTKWPLVSSAFMPIGKEGEFQIGDYVTASVYIYIPSTAKKDLSYKIYFELTGYENTLQTRNAPIGKVVIPTSEFVFDEWKRYSFTVKIPRMTENGFTNYVRFLLRYNNYDLNPVYNDGTVFYYGLPKLEKGSELTKWTPALLDRYNTESMSSKIALNPHSIKMISRNIDFNTDRMKIYNDKGNLNISGDTLRVSKYAEDTKNFVEINSEGLNIRKNGVDYAVGGLFLSETNIVPFLPNPSTFIQVPKSNNEYNYTYVITEDRINGAYVLSRDRYQFARDNKQLEEKNGTDKAVLGAFSYFHNRRYLKVSYICYVTEGNNFYVTFSEGVGWKKNDKINMFREIKEDSNTATPNEVKVLTVDLGPPTNLARRLVIQLAITGTRGPKQLGQITIARMSLSDVE